MTIDEIFATMADEGAEGGHEYLIIDPETRTITVPESERIFGVTGDELADRKYFMCPRYVGDGLDLAGMFLTVYFRTATDYEDGYLVDDVAVNGEYITFSWLLSSSVTEYKGTVQFSVCADLPNTAEKRRPDWNTTLASGEVLEGLDPDVGDVVGETSDVVTQLRAEIAASTAAVEAAGAAQVDVVEAAGAAATSAAQEQIEAKGAATLATIPADYATLANKTNEQANAIKGHLAGEIVQAGDVSPVEHYLGVKVRSANLLPTPYHHMTNEVNGVLWVAQEDGGIVATGTPENSSNIKLYQGDALVVSGYVTLSVSGATNARIAIALIDESDTVVFNTQADQITVNVDDYPTAKRWIVRLYSITDGVEMSETLYPKIEEGTEATEYTPYIDPAGVTVTRCGKNLLPFPYASAEQTYNGVTFTPNEDGSVTINGTATGDGISFMLVNTGPGGRRYLPAGTYFLSCPELANADLHMSIFFYDDNETTVFNGTGGKNKAFTLDKSQYYGVYFRIYGGVTVENLTLHPQLELGNIATAYEKYTGDTAMPAQDGTVTGLPSAAPTMTLLTDKAGVTIDCIYNRDSNAVYAELLAKIAALSGTN